MKRSSLALLALATGLIYSFPHWWWYFTLPNYSVARGYILADNDFLPYAAGLNATTISGLPPVTYLLGVYENSHVTASVPVTYFLTNLILGNLMRVLGSLELLAAVGLLLSGAATFALTYALARAVLHDDGAALAATGLAAFRYPFYVGPIAAARQWLATGGQISSGELLSVLFPGMVNGWQLYPHLRWPAPGMVYWSFLIALIFSLRLARRLGDPAAPARYWGLAAGLSIAAGLAAYFYAYFWTFLAALLVVLAAVGGLAGQWRWTRATGAAAVVAVVLALPLLVLQRFESLSLVEVVTRHLGELEVRSVGELNDAMGILAVHGMIALGILLTVRRDAPPPPAAAGRFDLTQVVRRAAGQARQGWKQPEAGWLLCLYGTTALLSLTDVVHINLQAWHWPKYMLDNLAPIGAAWLLLQVGRRGPADSAGDGHFSRRGAAAWAAWAAACLALSLGVWSTQRAGLAAALAAGLGLGLIAPAVYAAAQFRRGEARASARAGLTRRIAPYWPALGGAAVSAGAWIFYHRSINEMSWVALLPLAAGLATLGGQYLRVAVGALAGLNVLLAVSLQVGVRPVMAREFFAIQPEYAEALHWLRDNTAPGSVTVTNGWTSDYMLRAYTHNLTLGAADWWSGLIPSERAERTAVRGAIYDVTPEAQRQIIAGRPEAVATFKANVTRYWAGGADMDLLSERQGAIAWYNRTDYDATYGRPLAELLGRYRTDYIWVGPWEREAGQRDFASAPEVTLVFDNSAIQIYQVNTDTNEAQADRRHSEQ